MAVSLSDDQLQKLSWSEFVSDIEWVEYDDKNADKEEVHSATIDSIKQDTIANDTIKK